MIGGYSILLNSDRPRKLLRLDAGRYDQFHIDNTVSNHCVRRMTSSCRVCYWPLFKMLTNHISFLPPWDAMLLHMLFPKQFFTGIVFNRATGHQKLHVRGDSSCKLLLEARIREKVCSLLMLPRNSISTRVSCQALTRFLFHIASIFWIICQKLRWSKLNIYEPWFQRVQKLCMTPSTPSLHYVMSYTISAPARLWMMIVIRSEKLGLCSNSI